MYVVKTPSLHKLSMFTQLFLLSVLLLLLPLSRKMMESTICLCLLVLLKDIIMTERCIPDWHSKGTILTLHTNDPTLPSNIKERIFLLCPFLNFDLDSCSTSSISLLLFVSVWGHISGITWAFQKSFWNSFPVVMVTDPDRCTIIDTKYYLSNTSKSAQRNCLKNLLWNHSG